MKPRTRVLFISLLLTIAASGVAVRTAGSLASQIRPHEASLWTLSVLTAAWWWPPDWFRERWPENTGRTRRISLMPPYRPAYPDMTVP